MTKAIVVVRVLLGLLFFVFGMNGLLHFLKMPPMEGDAGALAGIMTAHGWMRFVSVLQVIAGLLLLVGRYVPLALVILGPIIVNILLFHFMLAQSGAALGVLAAFLEVFLIWAYWRSFRGLFDSGPETLV